MFFQKSRDIFAYRYSPKRHSGCCFFTIMCKANMPLKNCSPSGTFLRIFTAKADDFRAFYTRSVFRPVLFYFFKRIYQSNMRIPYIIFSLFEFIKLYLSHFENEMLDSRVDMCYNNYRCSAGVAQLVEQLICNQQVGGSSPSTSSNILQPTYVIWGSSRVAKGGRL